MSGPEIEVQVTDLVREAIVAALEKVGGKEFASLSGVASATLERSLSSHEAYVKVTLVTLACQINKTHGDTISAHSSVSECLKGAVYRISRLQPPQVQEPTPGRSRVRTDELRPRRQTPTFLDRKSMRILNFSGNTIGFLILGYFLGGIFLGPLLGLSQCIGVSSEAPWLSPCPGSAVGLVVGAFGGLAYTYYYFVKKI